jgi:four helix bundle suffix protein
MARPREPGGVEIDYEDFLRQRRLPQWRHDDPLRQALVNRRCRTADEVAAWIVRATAGECEQGGQGGPSGPSEQNDSSTKSTSSTVPPDRAALYPEFSANAALVLIAACSLLDRQVAALAKQFEQEGGFSERLYRVRSAQRRNASPK